MGETVEELEFSEVQALKKTTTHVSVIEYENKQVRLCGFCWLKYLEVRKNNQKLMKNRRKKIKLKKS